MSQRIANAVTGGALGTTIGRGGSFGYIRGKARDAMKIMSHKEKYGMAKEVAKFERDMLMAEAAGYKLSDVTFINTEKLRKVAQDLKVTPRQLAKSTIAHERMHAHDFNIRERHSSKLMLDESTKRGLRSRGYGSGHHKMEALAHSAGFNTADPIVNAKAVMNGSRVNKDLARIAEDKKLARAAFLTKKTSILQRAAEGRTSLGGIPGAATNVKDMPTAGLMHVLEQAARGSKRMMSRVPIS
jgi:hypothetical protein